MSRSIRSSASTLASARPSWLASSGASTWTQTRSWSASASIAVPPLGGVVGVEVAGRAGDVDPVPAGEHADAADQVDRRDDRALQAVQLAERRQARGLALAPEPDRVGRPLPGRDPGLVDRMVRRRPATPASSARAAAREPVPAGRWSAAGWSGTSCGGVGLRVVGERRLARLPAIDQEVAVADAGVELDVGGRPELAAWSASISSRALPRW